MIGDDPGPGYTVATADVRADRATVMSLWRGNLDEGDEPEAKFQWFYCDHPNGPSTMLFLLHGAERTPVGTAGIGRRELVANGTVHRAGVLADLLVIPSHRTLFPAMELQRAATREGLAACGVVFGVPNVKAVPVFRRLGYAPIGDLVRFVVVLRYGEQLRRRMPAWLASIGGAVLDTVMPVLRRLSGANTPAIGEWRNTVDASFDDLWSRARSFTGVIGVRDAGYLKWRFLARSSHPHRVFALRAADGARLIGYAICEDARPTLHVRDFLVDRAVPGGVATLVDTLARHAYREGFSTLSLDFMGGDEDCESLRRAGMRERDRRPLFASFAVGQDVTLRKLPWYVTRADIDA
ncbi:MAG TPA: hypothetical protein VJR92_07885 [Gemmatimonadaceae bacterium]|nr:hypothetical protein [Gemmatimonadaceae bacterium]